jgi:hypothetical protein
MPVLAVDVVVSLVATLAGWELPPLATNAVWGLALTWMAALVGLGVTVARHREG